VLWSFQGHLWILSKVCFSICLHWWVITDIYISIFIKVFKSIPSLKWANFDYIDDIWYVSIVREKIVGARQSYHCLCPRTEFLLANCLFWISSIGVNWTVPPLIFEKKCWGSEIGFSILIAFTFQLHNPFFLIHTFLLHKIKKLAF